MPKGKARNGFTYIEVVISVLLLSVVLIPLFELLVRSNLHTVEVQKSTTALYLAQSKLEQYSNTPFYDISSVNKQTYPINPEYDYAVTVKETAHVGGYQTKTITVIIYYLVGQVERQVSLTMEKTNRDVKADQQAD